MLPRRVRDAKQPNNRLVAQGASPEGPMLESHGARGIGRLCSRHHGLGVASIEARSERLLFRLAVQVKIGVS